MGFETRECGGVEPLFRRKGTTSDGKGWMAEVKFLNNVGHLPEKDVSFPVSQHGLAFKGVYE